MGKGKKPSGAEKKSGRHGPDGTKPWFEKKPSQKNRGK